MVRPASVGVFVRNRMTHDGRELQSHQIWPETWQRLGLFLGTVWVLVRGSAESILWRLGDVLVTGASDAAAGGRGPAAAEQFGERWEGSTPAAECSNLASSEAAMGTRETPDGVQTDRRAWGLSRRRRWVWRCAAWMAARWARGRLRNGTNGCPPVRQSARPVERLFVGPL